MIEPSPHDPFKVKQCRSCEHSYGTHNSNGCMFIGFTNKGCNCKEYITKDNLRYLEWCYEMAKKK